MKSLVTGKQIHRGDLPEVPEQEGVESVLLISDCTPCFLAEVTGRNDCFDVLFHFVSVQIRRQVYINHLRYRVGYTYGISVESLGIQSRCSERSRM